MENDRIVKGLVSFSIARSSVQDKNPPIFVFSASWWGLSPYPAYLYVYTIGSFHSQYDSGHEGMTIRRKSNIADKPHQKQL